MSDTHGRREAASPELQYTGDASDLAERALIAVNALDQALPPTDGEALEWSAAEDKSLMAVLDVERWSRHVHEGLTSLSTHTMGDEYQALLEQQWSMEDAVNAHLGAFRESLPFAEAERRWLGDRSDELLFDEENGVRDHEVLSIVWNLEATIVSAAIPKLVRGRDLMERWMRWRRNLGEYENAGAPEPTRRALIGLADLVGGPDYVDCFLLSPRPEAEAPPDATAS